MASLNNLSSINYLVPSVRYTCRAVWCSKCRTMCTAEGLSWPLLCSPPFNSDIKGWSIWYSYNYKALLYSFVSL